jgi:hypothetical protein
MDTVSKQAGSMGKKLWIKALSRSCQGKIKQEKKVSNPKNGYLPNK